MDASSWLLPLQAAATLAMLGVIWFVQVVHYPLMARVGEAGFAAYEAAHVRSTAWVVTPLMLLEAATSAGLCLRPPAWIHPGEAWLGAALLAGVWSSTFLLQVPLHERLAAGFQARDHDRLVRGNWLRTTLWSARGALILCWLLRAPGGAG